MRLLFLASLLITVSSCGSSFENDINLTNPGPSLSVRAVEVVPNAVSLEAGQSRQLALRVTLSDDSELSASELVAWASQNESVARVSASGLVTAVAVGSTTVTGTYNGLSATAAITVTSGSTDPPEEPAVLESLEINPSSALSGPGASRQYRAFGTYDDGSVQELTEQVQWESNNTDVSISNTAGSNGRADIALAAAGGSTATVTATLDSFSAQSSLRIDQFVYVGTPSALLAFTVEADGTLSSAGPDVTTNVNNPGDFVFHPNGLFGYILNTAGSVAAYSVGSDGQLNPIGGELATDGGGNSSGAIDPLGRYFYSLAANNGRIDSYLINEDGSLTPNGNSIGSGGLNSFSIRIEPSGRYLYAANSGTIQAFTIQSNGRLLANGPLVNVGGNQTLLAIDPDGEYLYASLRGTDEMAFFTIEEDGTLAPNGANLPITDGTTPGDPNEMYLNPAGDRLYVSNFNNLSTDFQGVLVYSVGADGRVTLLQAQPTRNALNDTALDGAGRFAWTVSLLETLDAFTVSPTGELTPNPAGNLDPGDQLRFIEATP